MPIVFRCENCGHRYRVPEEKAGRKGKCRHCGADLHVPAPPEKKELPGGGTAYRHKPRERDFEPATGDEETIEAISDHIERHIGPVEGVFHEMVSDLVHVDVHFAAPRRQRPFHTLVTSGMSDRPMQAPEGAEAFRYAELMIYLPADWPLKQEDLNDEANYWPVRLMKMLARLPHEFDTWLAMDHTVPNGDPPQPYSPDTKLCCALLELPFIEDEGFWQLEVSPEKTINFFAIIPLYREEMELKLTKGTEPLLEKFEKHGIGPIIDVRRRNVARRRIGLF